MTTEHSLGAGVVLWATSLRTSAEGVKGGSSVAVRSATPTLDSRRSGLDSAATRTTPQKSRQDQKTDGAFSIRDRQVREQLLERRDNKHRAIYIVVMSLPIEGVQDWRSFESYARRYFSMLWNVDFAERSVKVGGEVPWRFDLVSADLQIVGDAKWLKNIAVPAAKWQAIAECIWLLQKVDARRIFMVFGQDAEVPERYLRRVRALTTPVEFYFLDGGGHKLL